MNTIKSSALAMLRTAVAAVAGVMCLFAITVGAARAWEINFEGLTDPGAGLGLIIDNEYATPGAITGDASLTATITGYQGIGATENPAVLFDTGASPITGGDIDLAAPFTSAALGVQSPGHVLILHEQPANCRDGGGNTVNGNAAGAVSCADPDDRGARPSGRIEIDFGANAVILDSIDFFDIEQIEGAPNRTDATNEVELFDVSGNQIMDNAFYVPATGGDNKWDVLNFGGIAGVSRVVVNLAGSGALDNIRGGTDAAYIPEPASIPSMVFGLGLIGWLRRRYRRG